MKVDKAQQTNTTTKKEETKTSTYIKESRRCSEFKLI